MFTLMLVYFCWADLFMMGVVLTEEVLCGKKYVVKFCLTVLIMQK